MPDAIRITEPHIDGRRFQAQLDNLAELVALKMERGWPQHLQAPPGAVTDLIMCLRTVRLHYRASCFLVADGTMESAGWSNEHMLLLTPIARTCLEALFNTCFLLEDLPSRSIWFEQHGWRESVLNFRLHKERYGNDSESGMDVWLEEMEKLLELGKRLLGITDKQAANPRSISEWPTPGKMWCFEVNERLPNAQLPPLRRFMKELYFWHYKPLSAEVHSNGYGQMRVGGLTVLHMLSAEERKQAREVTFPKIRAQGTYRIATFLLCIVCELQHYLQLNEGDISARLLSIWAELSAVGEVKELFELRYKEMYPMTILGGF